MASISPRHVARYRDIATVLIRHGRSGALALDGEGSGGVAGNDRDVDAEDVPPEAERLAADLEELGPTFVKLGQLLSTRPDLLAPGYTQALARLQDDVEPFSFAEVERSIGEQLGASAQDVFAELDHVPMASASLGQVHAGRLRDGRPVVVKVQRPGIRQQVEEDIEALSQVASFLDEHTDAGRRFGFADLLRQFQRSLMDELDYRREAANLKALGRMLAGQARIVVPAPVDDFTTGTVLTMDRIDGRKVTELGPLAVLEMDLAPLAEDLFEAYLRQILVEGFFHADPHPGNVLVTRDCRLALIDLGMVARVPSGLQDRLVKLLLAVADGDGEQAAEEGIAMGRRLEDFDEARFRREVVDLVGRTYTMKLGDLEAGSVVMEMTAIAGECGLRSPPELALLGKALLNLDQVATRLDPDFSPGDAIKRHVGEILSNRARLSLNSALSSVLEAKGFVEKLPRRVNDLMDAVSDGRFNVHVKVDAVDEQELLDTVHKLANRVTAGLVLAALIMGAALMMRVDTEAQILGYPAIAIVCFLAAATGGFVLLGSIVVSNRRNKKRLRQQR